MAVLVVVVLLTIAISVLALHVGAFFARRHLTRGPTFPGNPGVRVVQRDVATNLSPQRAHETVVAAASTLGGTAAFTSPAQVIISPKVSLLPFDSVVSAWFTPSMDADPDATRTTVLLESRPVAQGIPIDAGNGARTMDAIEATLLAGERPTSPGSG